MNAVVLSFGTELTTGQNVDTNSAWLSAELTRMGVTVARHETVDDHLGRMTASIRRALDESEFVIATGGLGPTADDLTRQALAAAIGATLEESADALAQLRAFFERSRRTMHEGNRVQAQIPRGCEMIRNDWGTAPGLRYRGDSVELFALPGVPNEMKNMFQAAVAPAIVARVGGACTFEARVHCFGWPEAKVGDVLVDLMQRDRNPLVGTLASRAVITVRILARGDSEENARRLLKADRADICQRLGDVVFGQDDDTLESVVGAMLRGRGLRIAVAESCTGGLLAKRITDVPGSSDYFVRGYVAYADTAKEEMLGVPAELIRVHGAVSEEVARAMAAGCLAASTADLAVAMTGVAGPGGGTADKPVGLVFFGLADASGVETRRVLFGPHLSRNEIRDRSCSTALDMVRRRLTKDTMFLG